MELTKNVKEVIIDRETVYLKKDMFGWHEVHPIKNKDGTINWKNLIAGGSWAKLGIIIFIVLVILGCVYEYSNSVIVANDCLNNSCQTCFSQQLNYTKIIMAGSGATDWSSG